MDQLKKILAGAVKHQFWIITSVAAVMACIAWFMYSSLLEQQYEESAKTIDEKFKAMQTVSSAVATHPNEHSIAEMSKIIDGLASDVETAWRLQYQRQEQFLKWREDKLKMPLLISKLKRLYPIEQKATYPDEPKNPLISNEEKRRFSQYFAEQMPELANIIGVTWVGEAFSAATGGGGMGMGGMGMGMGGGEMGDAGGYPGTGMGDMGMGDMGSGGMGGMGMGGMGGMGMGGMGMGGMGMMMGPQSNDVVIWSKASQSQLLTSLKMWQGDQPTVFQMMYTQENMWILEGIFNIIAKTNLVPETGKPATANFQATVKEIEFIRIGRDAVANAGSISGVGGGMGMGGMGMGGMGMGGMGMGGMGDAGMGGMGDAGMGDMGSSGMSPDGGSYGSEGSGSEMGGDAGGMGGYGMGMGMGSVVSIDPADRRYVDAAYKPITGEELRTKITSQNAEDAYFAVAKRIPVRLKFKIDYSQVQRFLANCGNEGLMLEVRQVRVGQFQDAAAGFGMGGMGGGMGGMGGMPGTGGGDYEDGGGLMGPGGMGMGDAGSSGMGYPGTGMGDMGSSGMGGMDMGGMDMGGMGSMGMGGMGMGGMGMGAIKKSPELTVEVYGIVYLFNPANIDSLGLNKVTEDTEIKDTVSTPPEEPVAAPPVDAGAPSGDPAPNGGASTGASAPTAPTTPPTGPPTPPPAGAPTTPPAGAPTTPPAGTPSAPPAGSPTGPGSTPAPTGS